MYQVYLSAADRYIYNWTETFTQDMSVAEAAFRELIGYDFLIGQPYQVTLRCNEKLLACHRFDCPAGSANNWTARPLPESTECIE